MTGRWWRAPCTAAAWLALALACAGGSRPFYPAGGPPFISPKGYSLHRHAEALGGRTPAHRLILIGDAGLTNGSEATLAELGRWSAEPPGRTAVAFLGDNLYPRGLGEEDERGEAILLRQLRATPARKVFVPGNHDWGEPWWSAETLGRQQRFIDGFTESPAALLPKGGCPRRATARRRRFDSSRSTSTGGCSTRTTGPRATASRAKPTSCARSSARSASTRVTTS
jgi:hypothetical protein